MTEAALYTIIDGIEKLHEHVIIKLILYTLWF